MPLDLDYDIEAVVIYDSQLYGRTSHIADWARSVARQFLINAVRRAPVNKRPNKSPWYAEYPVGALRESIDTDAYKVGPAHWQVVLTIDVPYAKWVIGGTEGPITATTANYMTLPRNPGYPRGRRRFTVSGQRPNNFLSAAAAATARTHSSLRGLDDLLFQQT